LRSVIDLPAIKSFMMSRGVTEDSWGDDDEKPLWQEVVLTTEYEVLDGTRRLSEVRLRTYTQLIARSKRKSAIETDIYCKSFRYFKSVDNGGLAQTQRLLQFGRVLSRCIE